jgi:hypothetical protein
LGNIGTGLLQEPLCGGYYYPGWQRTQLQLLADSGEPLHLAMVLEVTIVADFYKTSWQKSVGQAGAKTPPGLASLFFVYRLLHMLCS